MSEGAQPRHVGEQQYERQSSDSTRKVGQRQQSLQNNLQQKPPHHGSSSTTFSTGSSLSASTSCGDGEVIEPSSYYSSAAESSGVATMSSFDNLPPSISKLISGGGRTPHDADLDLDSDEDCGRNNTLKASSTSALNCNDIKWDLGLAESSQAMDSLRLQSSPGTSAASNAAVAAAVSLTGPSSAPAGAAAFPRMPSTRSTGSGMTEAALCEAARRQAGLLPPASPASHSTGSSSHQLQQQQHCSTSPLPPPLTSVAMTCANSCTQIICTPLRTIVSQNRRRYQQDGFNLDLTYITDRIIAMGYPADTKEALYRNSMSHIVKFLEHYHPGHYKVFNLRGQYVYDASKFHNRVVSFEMTDHHPPRLELMAPFCREVGDYLEADPRNVVAVHCKAGKGRTGVMICAYLCYIAFYRSPRQNMDYYSIVRTHNNKGVTIPSQRRYVYYFSHLRERRLNYMPLRVELVGVYVERPPKLSGTFSKGALNVQVANGDVDVFLGDDLWLSEEKSEEEDEMYKRYPVMIGDDQYDPNRPTEGKNCISRRCYGWSVPANKRVFLEGDIRVDIHQKRVLPVFNVKQDKKKIGRVWFNTMFVCPGFCGGEYVHGDEAYPYPEGESMIVQRVVRKKSSQSFGAPENIAAAFTPPEHISLKEGSQQGESPAPTRREHNSNGGEWRMLAEKERQSSNQSLLTGSSKSKSSQQSKNVPQTTFNGVSKKRPNRSPCSQLIDSENKGWSSQDGESSSRRGVDEGAPFRGHKCRSSLDHTSILSSSSSSGTRVCRSARGSGEGSREVEESLEWDEEEEIVVPEPPGLSTHCPPESIQEIYHSEKQAPRVGIVDILKEAYKRNLLRDLYNARRFSVPKEGNLMPKSSVGRPNAESTPRCLMRDSVEHVAIYSAQEIDGAHKSKEVDMNYFKLYIVTKCIDERNAADVRLTDSFLRITHQKQLRRDEAKREKLEGRQKKLSSQLPVKPVAVEAYGGAGKQGDESSSFSSDGIHDSAAAGVHGGDTSLLREFNDDPRLSDPYLRKFFFRQRISSHSRHPSVHYHCPLLEQDLLICARHKCPLATAANRPAPTEIGPKPSSSTAPSSSAGAGNHQRTSYRRQMHFPSRGLAAVGTYGGGSGERDEGEERDDESGAEDSGSGGGQGEDNFENFDFFHPNAFASLKERRVMMAREDSSKSSLGSSTLHNRTPVDSTATPSASTSANTTTAIYVRSATLTSVDACDELAAGEHLLESSLNPKNRTGRSGRSAREERLRGRSTGDLLFGDGEAMCDEPARDFHPSDCSWASSSSTSSSTQSLDDTDPTAPPHNGKLTRASDGDELISKPNWTTN